MRKETEIYTKDFWVAEDGEVFEREDECKKYEEEKMRDNLCDKLLDDYPGIVYGGDYAPLNFDGFAEDSDFHWLKPTTESAAEALTDAFGEIFYEGDWACVICNDWGDYNVTSLTEVADAARAFFESFGLHIEITGWSKI